MASITLKWGTLKAWDLNNESPRCMDLMRQYRALGASLSAMSHKDTDEQKRLLCEVIDAFAGEIFNDWSGEKMSKDDAKKYIMEYR